MTTKYMTNSKNLKYIIIIFVLILLFLSNTSFLFTAKAEGADKDGDGLDKLEEELIGTDSSKERSPGLYCEYKTSYKTKDYNSWKTYSGQNGSITIALEKIVIRRGTTIELGGNSDGEISIESTKENMDELSVDGWDIKVPDDNTVGKYVILIEDGGWKKTMDLYIVFDPFNTGLSDDKIDGYAYNEYGTRDERGYIYTNSGNLFKGDLYPFGDDNKSITDIYEFALAGVGNTSDPILASVKLVRIVAQRNTARPKEPPQLRDPRKILYFNQGKIEGLTVADARKLSMNGVNRDKLADKGYTKTLGAWCDECAFALTGLLRSIGIPSRIVSLHPSKDTKLMGNYISEAWFEESMYEADWIEDKGDWYALDADEWNAEWDTDPKFWMPMGECYASRSNYGFASEYLFRVNYDYDVKHYYVLGTEDIEEPILNEVTSHYEDDKLINLKYGNLKKYKGRGGGDFYKVSVQNYSKLSLTSNGGIDPNIYINSDKYPALKISYQGYPPHRRNKNNTGKEVILEPGEYYIAVFAPEVGSNSLEGNYGEYTLRLKRTSKSEIDDPKEDIKLKGYKYIISISLIIVWLLSFVIMKYY